MLNFLKAKFPWLIQFVSFGFIGAFNTLLFLGVYDLCVILGFDEQLGNFFAFIITVLNAFFWNYKWVFKNSTSSKLAIVKFFTLYTATYFISAGLLIVWIDVLHIHKLIAPMLSLIITIPTNFLVSKFWVFKSKIK